jgi:hypothetical protein
MAYEVPSDKLARPHGSVHISNTIGAQIHRAQ